MPDDGFSLPPGDGAGLNGGSAGLPANTTGAEPPSGVQDGSTPAAPAANGGNEFDFSAADLDSQPQGGNNVNEDGNPQGKDGDGSPAGDYSLVFAEGSAVPEAMRDDLTGIAREIGVDAKQAAELLDKSLNAYITRNEQVMQQEGAKLKQEWGDRYEANVKAVKPLMVRVLQKAGIPLEQAGPLKSPMGFRLMNAVRELMGESSAFAGSSKGQPTLSVQQQIERIYNDPEKMAILANPGDARWAEVNAELNRLMGLPN